MTINCGKAVKKFVKKSAQKTCRKNVEKISKKLVSHINGEFCRVLNSFTQPISTWKNASFNLLNASFYTFYTDPTNTIKIIKGNF